MHVLSDGSHQDMPLVYSDMHPACQKTQIPCQKLDSDNADGIIGTSQQCFHIQVTPWNCQLTIILTPIGQAPPNKICSLRHL